MVRLVAGPLLALLGCAGPEPVPVLANPPRSLAIVLAAEGAAPAPVSDAIAMELDGLLRERGYRVAPLPGDAPASLRGAAGLDRVPAEALAAARAAGIDGLLLVQVARWDASWGSAGLNEFRSQVHYRLVDTATGALLWSRDSRSRYDAVQDSRVLSDESGQGFYRWESRSLYATERDVVRALQRDLVGRMPYGPGAR